MLISQFLSNSGFQRSWSGLRKVLKLLCPGNSTAWTAAGMVLTTVLSLLLLFSSPALASVHRYPEAANGVLYRSLQTLRDRSDRAWQLVLFKRMDATGQTETLRLRLVGFPGSVEISHPAALGITSSQQGWKAPDALVDPSTFPANVGEYDVLEFATGLASNAPLQIVLPTTTGAIELTIPPFVVQEWRQVAAIQPDQEIN